MKERKKSRFFEYDYRILFYVTFGSLVIEFLSLERGETFQTFVLLRPVGQLEKIRLSWGDRARDRSVKARQEG